MGQPVHVACVVAVPVDMGDGVSSGARLGFPASRPGGRRAGGQRQRGRGAAAPDRRAREQPEGGRPLMELLLILIYVSICYAVFKIFKIPVNQWSLATAALGGIIGIALLLLIMNYNHPFTKNARIYFSVTSVLSAVPARVIEVTAQLNAAV